MQFELMDILNYRKKSGERKHDRRDECHARNDECMREAQHHL